MTPPIANEEIELRVQSVYGPIPIVAQRSAASGLVVHRPLRRLLGADKSLERTSEESPGWTVTHVRSGHAVAHFASVARARRFCVRVADLADWNRPKSALPKSARFKAAIQSARHAERGWR